MDDLERGARDRRAGAAGGRSRLFDLDGFKRYNDAYGHPAGDALLQRLSAELADVVARPRPGLPARRRRVLPAARRRHGSDAVLRAAAAAALEARGDGFDVDRLLRPRARCPRTPPTARRRCTSPTAACTRPRRARPSSAGPADPQRAAQGALRARARPARALDRRDGASPRGVARRLGLPPDERDDRRARGRAARHRQDGDPGRDPQQAGAAGRARVALHAPPHDHRRGHPQRGARAAAGRRAGAREPRALGRQAATRTAPPARRSPQGARIVAVCDAFSAMVQERPYQPGADRAARRSRRSSAARASNFDPAVVVAAFAAEIRSEAVPA